MGLSSALVVIIFCMVLVRLKDKREPPVQDQYVLIQAPEVTALNVGEIL